MPQAIAPEETTTTSRPARCRRATSAQIVPSASRRTTPASSATTLDPSFMTTGPVRGASPFILPRAARSSPLRSLPGIELELHAGDLHVVAGLEARGLELADDHEPPQAALEHGQRLLVVEVVARHEPLGGRAGDPEAPLPRRLDPEAAVGAGAEDAVLGQVVDRGGLGGS